MHIEVAMPLFFQTLGRMRWRQNSEALGNGLEWQYRIHVLAHSEQGLKRLHFSMYQ